MSHTVFFFANGNTAVTDGNRQVPRLQRSWLRMFVEFLESEGVNPDEVEFRLPDSSRAEFFKTSEGAWNWRVIG